MKDFLGYRIGGVCKDVPQLGGRYGFSVVVDDQSVNGASGTAKDHKSAFLLEKDAAIEGEITYLLITSGNAGYSLGRLCEAWNKEHPDKPRRVLNFVDNRMSNWMKERLQLYGQVRELDLGKEKYPNNALDALAGGNGVYKLAERMGTDGDGYASLEEEIPDADIWFCPAGEAEMASQIAVKARARKKKPKIVAVTRPDSILVRSGDFNGNIRKSPMDKLAAAYSDYKDIWLRLCQEDGHETIIVSDKEALEEYFYLKDLCIPAEPSAAAAFAGARKYAKQRKLTLSDRGVIINTGSGLFDEPLVNRWSWYAKAAGFGLLLASIAASGYGLRMWQSYERERQNYEFEQRIRKSMEYVQASQFHDHANTFPAARLYLEFALAKAIDTNMPGTTEQQKKEIRDIVISKFYDLSWLGSGGVDGKLARSSKTNMEYEKWLQEHPEVLDFFDSWVKEFSAHKSKK